MIYSGYPNYLTGESRDPGDPSYFPLYKLRDFRIKWQNYYELVCSGLIDRDIDSELFFEYIAHTKGYRFSRVQQHRILPNVNENNLSSKKTRK